MPSKEGFYYTISIHAPRAGSDQKAAEKERDYWEFQSTLPVRGATQRLVSFYF